MLRLFRSKIGLVQDTEVAVTPCRETNVVYHKGKDTRSTATNIFKLIRHKKSHDVIYQGVIISSL